MARFGGATMGTTWSVTLVGLGEAAVRAVIEAELALVIEQMSQWQPQSALSRFNRAPAGSWHSLPPALFHVLRAACEVADASDGAFDPTAGRLADLWGFGPEPPAMIPPDAQAIADAEARAGWQRLQLDVHARRALQPGGLALDLSGIAKGHAVDRVAERLAGMGARHALIEIGGELRGLGVRPDGDPWWVDLEDEAAVPGLRVALHDLAVATSGDSERSHDEGLGHTLDPRTGAPVANGVASVSVLHPQAMMADAFATALTVLGPERGMMFAVQHALPARILARRGATVEERISPALAEMMA